MSCPLTLTYLSGLTKWLEEKAPILFAETIDNVNNLKERSEVVPGTKEYQRLRAFYCVELLYSPLIREALNKDRLLMAYAGSHVALAPVVAKLTEEVPRSWEGLGTLIQRVDDLDGEITIQLTELAFAKKARFGEREEVMIEERLKKTLKVFECCSGAAKLLRRSLGNDDSPIRPIGRALAVALEILQVPYSERINYGITLLNISPDNPVTVWPTKTESPE